MKTIRKVLKLMLPGCFMHWRLSHSHGINVNKVSKSSFVRFLVAILPYVVSAILQQRAAGDRRAIRYFLPYGRMRRNAYTGNGMQVGDASREVGLTGLIRAILPYGLILWWDREDDRPKTAGESKAAGEKSHVDQDAAAKAATDKTMAARVGDADVNAALAREHLARMDVLALRSITGRVQPSVTVVLTGRPSPEKLSAALQNLAETTIRNLDVLLAVEKVDMTLAAAEMPVRRIPISTIESTGKTIDEVRNLAVEMAKGDYLAFLECGDSYAARSELEALVLTAIAEDADVCGGQCDVAGRFVLATISGVLFNTAWLRASGLKFVAAVTANERIFLNLAAKMAGRTFHMDRTLVTRGGAADRRDFTAWEGKVDLLNALVKASRLVSAVVRPDVLRAELLREVERGKADLREIAWAGNTVPVEIEAKIRELAANLGKGALVKDLLSPLVSVVVPAYNVERRLARCLDSLVTQSLPSIEIIVVDDGATDSTPAIADSYASKHPQFKVIHRQNGGLSAARNSGMRAARGKYIGFVDGDDYVDREMFLKMASALEGDELAELAVCEATVESTYEVSERDSYYAQKCFDLPKATGGYKLTPDLMYDINSSVCTKVYRRDFLFENDIWFPEGMNNEDEVMFFFTMGKANYIQIVSEPIYHYVRNKSGIMAKAAEAFDRNATIPDSLDKAFPLIATYLAADDRRDMLGVFYRHVYGVATCFNNEDAYRRISQILHCAQFYYYREFLDLRDLGCTDNTLKAIYNYNYMVLPPLAVDASLMPKVREPPCACEHPILSFILPVYNQERYLAFCIESLRRQTEQNIEIVCVDDGSSDRSWWLMQRYAEFDGRIRIFHQDNAGVASARNFALDQAKGRYVAFVDGDDYVELTMAEEVCRKMRRDNLDACAIDFQCADYKTRQPVKHYWELRNHRAAYPNSSVFAFDELKEVAFFGGAAGTVWSLDFLNRNNLRFSNLVNNEDLMFNLNGWIRTERMGVILSIYYHYRRGNPNSAVSKRASPIGDETVIDSFREMIGFMSLVQSCKSSRTATLVANRLLIEVVFYATSRPRVLKFLQEEGFDLLKLDYYRPLGEPPSLWRRYEQLKRRPRPADKEKMVNCHTVSGQMPVRYRRIAWRIEQRRASSPKDLYIITGQLNSAVNEPIDSWTFFKWLQGRGVPSRYVMWKKHRLYSELKKRGELKDVILLSGDGVSNCEFLEKCEDALVRCSVVAQENGAMNPLVRQWLYFLPDLQYTFLEHGIKFWKYTASIGYFFAGFNVINNSSTFEKELLEAYLPGHVETGVVPNCIVGGLPRFDLVKDERENERDMRYVFVMFTWRRTFNNGQGAVEKSAYYHGIRALVNADNVARLKACGVKIVISAHHHLVNHIKDLNFGEGVEIVPQDNVGYWKAHADLCLTDYSSITFDFLLQGKPVIYWVPDREDMLLSTEDHAEIIEADRRRKYIFNVVDSSEEVIDMIVHYARTDFRLEPEKKEIARKFFGWGENFCQHLYEALEATTVKRSPREC